MSNKGWECPRCGDVYGPSVPKCTNEACKKKPGEISDADLHTQLYTPTIAQFPDGAGKGGGENEGGDGSTGIY